MKGKEAQFQGEVDEEEDRRYGKDKRGDELPVELAFREGRLERIREAMAALEADAQAAAEQAEGKDHPGVPEEKSPAQLHRPRVAHHARCWWGDPRQPFLPNCRRLVLPVHPLGRSSLAALLGCVSPVAGDVEFQDDGVVHDAVNRCGGGHGVGEDALPLREDQVGGDAQRPALVALGDQGEKDLGLLVAPVSST